MRLYDKYDEVTIKNISRLAASCVFMKARNVSLSVKLSLNKSSMKPHLIKIIGPAWAAALKTGCQGIHSTEQSDFPKV